MTEKTPKSLGTHNGTFHADEVAACALLLLFGRIDRNKIQRTRDAAVLDQCEYVCDVGGIYDLSLKRFDHHQADYQEGMSSAGMILHYLFQEGELSQQEYDHLNGELIRGVDEEDNGIKESHFGRCTFSDVIENFLPARYDAGAEARGAAFEEALDFTLGHLTRLLEKFQYLQSCRESVEKAMATNKRFMSFEEAIPWQDLFFEMDGEKHSAHFLVMPSGEHWKVRAIPPSLDQKMSVRTPLPEKWAGLLEEDLVKVSGIEGAIFCHKGRFISVWRRKEDAMQALKICLKEIES